MSHILIEYMLINYPVQALHYQLYLQESINNFQLELSLDGACDFSKGFWTLCELSYIYICIYIYIYICIMFNRA